MVRRWLWLWVVICLQGCSVTLYSWKDPLPEVGQTQGEREAAVRHFGIAEIRGSGFINFETQPRFTTADAEGRYYDLYTYAPVILQVAPETEPLFDEARRWSRWQLGVDSALMLAVLAPLSVATLGDEAVSPESGRWIYGGMVLALLGLGVLEYVLELQEYERYEQIRRQFNAALEQRFGSKE